MSLQCHSSVHCFSTSRSGAPAVYTLLWPLFHFVRLRLVFLCSAALNMVVLFSFYFYSCFLLGIEWGYHLHGLTSKLEILSSFLPETNSLLLVKSNFGLSWSQPRLFLPFFFGLYELFKTNWWGCKEAVYMARVAVMTKKLFSITNRNLFFPKASHSIATSQVC